MRKVTALTRLLSRRVCLASALLGCGLVVCAQNAENAQPPISVPEEDPGVLGQAGYRFENGVPGGVSLIPHGAGARNGRVWVGNTGASIRIVGEVDGPAPDWPKDRDSILLKDHVEVWFAQSGTVQLPPAEWSQRFEADVTTPDACANLQTQGVRDENPQQECRDWFATQEQYRPIFQRLFVRQWLLANGISEEAYATPAYDAVTTKYKPDGIEALKPSGDVQFRSQARAGKTGYLFEVDIPYSAFPPLDSAPVADMRLMVDVFSAAAQGHREGAFSTTASNRAFGKPETFNKLEFNPPLPFQITPCNVPLSGKMQEFSPVYPAWFIPSAGAGGFQADTFLLEDWGGPDGETHSVSPSVFPMHNFWRKLGLVEWVCGPNLAYRNGSMIHSFHTDITLSNGDKSVSEEGFDARKDADGTALVKTGPRVWNAASMSQCGACDRVDFTIYAIDKNLNLIRILGVDDVIDAPGLASQDFSLSPDWSNVVEYDQKSDAEGKWSSKTYCRSGMAYSVCGSQDEDVKPPEPSLIRQFLNQ
ncbi:MAG: hypothetical protein ACRD40_05355 [Candidatus Acidiferrales bacterium]